LKKLEIFLEKLGLKRNFREEKRLKNLSSELVKKRIFNNKNSLIDYDYLEKNKYLVFIWKSKIFDGEEFMSLFLSYIN
jgi:hypothetical protein